MVRIRYFFVICNKIFIKCYRLELHRCLVSADGTEKRANLVNDVVAICDLAHFSKLDVHEIDGLTQICFMTSPMKYSRKNCKRD